MNKIIFVGRNSGGGACLVDGEGRVRTAVEAVRIESVLDGVLAGLEVCGVAVRELGNVDAMIEGAYRAAHPEDPACTRLQNPWQWLEVALANDPGALRA